MLLADHEPVGTGAHGNLSLTEMLMRTPEPDGSHQTFTSANRPTVFRRSRTMSSVSISIVSPMETPATERTVASSVRTLPITRTSVISSPTANAGRDCPTSANPMTAAIPAARKARRVDDMSQAYRHRRDS